MLSIKYSTFIPAASSAAVVIVLSGNPLERIIGIFPAPGSPVLFTSLTFNALNVHT